MKTKLNLPFSLMLISAFVLAACGGGATATQAPAPAPAVTEAPAATEAPVMTEAPAMEPVTIAFWEQEGDDVDVFIDGLIADFEAANPDITVERTHYENGLCATNSRLRLSQTQPRKLYASLMTSQVLLAHCKS